MELIDISKWPSGNQRFVPIGKRIKKVVLHPETYDLFYFKEPKEKYPWEFWNEIIAFKIGKEFGFNVLEYQPAILDGLGGCLSPSMTTGFTEELMHGQQLLIRILPEFETKKGTDHTFQLVEEYFKSDITYTLLLNDFIEMLVFDSIIGNRDRHQQNWALIREISFKKSKQKYLGFRKKIDLSLEVTGRFSPLFDNGNCLAYNVIEDKIDNFLEDDKILEKYLFGEKAVSHVKWFGESMPHIELLKRIFQNYPIPIENAIFRVRKKYNENIIEDIVNNIDNGVIFANKIYDLTPKRKELVIKLIKLRIEKLLNDF